MVVLLLALIVTSVASFSLPSLSFASYFSTPTRCRHISSSRHNIITSTTRCYQLNIPEPPRSSAAYSLYHLILQNRAYNNNGSSNSSKKAIPLAGIHDALSAKIFAQQGASALFMSGFGVSASLLGLPDAGMTNLVEMEMMARNICSVVRSPDCCNLSLGDDTLYPPPLICDGDTGYGGASNMIRTISALANAGAAAISIEDQCFPKKCTIAAGSKIQIVDREEAIQRVRGALGARDLFNKRRHDSGMGPWIVARTDSRMAFGFDEVLERCLRFEELGAEIIYAENLQSRDEYETLRDRLDPRTITMVAQVQETIGVTKKSDSNSKPLFSIQEIGDMGFDLAVFGVSPLQCVVGTLESTTKEFLGTNTDNETDGTGIISSQSTMADFATVKKVAGFDELESFEREYPCTSTPTTTDVADDDDITPIDDMEVDSDDKDKTPADIINGTSEGFIVTQVYTYSVEGIPDTNLSSTFSVEDIARLCLEPKNVTLPAALMLLDPEKYPTQSRARKACRKRTICISRDNSSSSSFHFNELGKVIARVYPGDSIGYQRRKEDNYYSAQGTPYQVPPFELPIVYEDDYMAIVNKPAGIVLYRAEGGRGGGSINGGHGRDTLLSALPYVLTPASSDIGDEENVPLKRPQPVHRLDRPTSGLVVVGKRKKSLVNLAQLFEFRKVQKTYTAIVNGMPVSSNNGQEWNTIDYDLDGKSSITKWRVIKTIQSLHGKGGQITLVELKPKTGRYHQLRRHLAWVCKSPIVGDTTYDGDDESAKRLRKRGMFLCSNELELEHPYYNTDPGHKEWIDMSQSDKKKIIEEGDALLVEDEDTGNVLIKTKIELPKKFSSFLEREHTRALKFGA